MWNGVNVNTLWLWMVNKMEKNWMIENNEWLDGRDFSSHTGDGKLRILCERIEQNEKEINAMKWQAHTAQIHAFAYEKAKNAETKERELSMLLTILTAQRFVGSREGFLDIEAIEKCVEILTGAGVCEPARADNDVDVVVESEMETPTKPKKGVFSRLFK
tara:strand:+ start:377 stop:856 length:480 start_codon:yes stop_codon:yes gene_type:complete